jgi:MinD-like ATPase involved in chromosome partitioning or flagellar assembly
MTGNGNGAASPAEIIGVIGARGGTGQTTVSLDWARALSQDQRRCLLLEVAGGDLAALTGAAPSKFAEDVAEGGVSLDEAVTPLSDGPDLLAAGVGWSVFGPPTDAIQRRLIERLSAGPWTSWVIDLGRARPHRHHPVWSLCRTIAVVVQDELACVTRTYALIRHLLACGWGSRLGLVLNCVSDGHQAERLRRHLEQITRAFLHFTVPVIGVVPRADAAQRLIAVKQWASPARDGVETVSRIENRITSPALSPDRTE